MERLSKVKYFQKYLLECEQDPLTLSATSAFSLESLLINPIQRIPRYQLLLQGISEVTELNHDDYQAVQVALKQICEIAQFCNQCKAASDVLGNYYRISALLAKELKFESFIQSHRRLVCEATVNIQMKNIVASRVGAPAKQNLASTLSSKLRDVRESLPLHLSRSRSNSTSNSNINETYTAYVFSDAVVLEKDRSVSETKSKHIELFFLHFCTLSVDTGGIHLETVSENHKRSIIIRPKEQQQEEGYQDKYDLFLTSLQECIQTTQSLYQQKLKNSTNMVTIAHERLQEEGQRKVAQVNLHDNLMMALDSRKRLHTVEEDIIRKEDELKRLQEELAQLREDRKNFLMMTKMTETKVNDFSAQLQVHLKALAKVDTVLLAGLNDEAEAFQKVFNDEPCVVRFPEANTQENDIYHGMKLRRKSGQVEEKPESMDYSAFGQSPLREVLVRNYNESSLLFSSVIYSVNGKGQASERRLVVTEASLTLFKKSGSSIKYHIPIRSITCVSTSSYDDHFICVHSAELNDFLFYSRVKTEILQVLVNQAKVLYDRDLFIQVATSFIFYPVGGNTLKRIRMQPHNMDQDDFMIVPTADLWRVKYDPKKDDASFRQNKIYLQKEVQQLSDSNHILTDNTPSSSTDVYSGKKIRRRASINRMYYGDYLSHFRGAEIKKLPIDTSNIQFCDEVQKVNERLKSQTRILLITDTTLYYVEPGLKTVKGALSLLDVDSVDVSPFNDNYFLIHSKSGVDLLMYAEKKTEILTVLRGLRANVPIYSNNYFNFRRKDRTITGTFTDNTNTSEVLFQPSGINAFNVTASRLMRWPIIIESMEVQIDGLSQPVIVTSDVYPVIKLPRSSTFLTCIISYYALDSIKGYHIEQSISQKSLKQLGSVVYPTSIEDSAKSDKKYTVTLKKQKFGANRITKTQVKIRILDEVGQEVVVFRFSAQL
jgi:hypothetical protein